MPEAQALPVNTSHNSAFSSEVPGLQLALDSTSLNEAICLRKYYYSIICGWEPRQRSVDLTFGILVHRGKETYYKAKARGASHQEALRVCLKTVLVESWDQAHGRAIEMADPQKNRVSLVRALVWTLDESDGDDPFQTITLASGEAAAELSFRFDTGYRSRLTGASFLLCGHLDRIAEFGGQHYIEDTKTTRHQLDARWLSQFTPDNQFSTYTLAGQVVWHQEIAGMTVSGIQIGVNFVRSRRVLVPRPPSVIEEWHQDLGWKIAALERAAEAQYWPMDDRACGLYGGCKYRAVCARPPGARQQWLEADFTRRVWDPLQAR